MCCTKSKHRITLRRAAPRRAAPHRMLLHYTTHRLETDTTKPKRRFKGRRITRTDKSYITEGTDDTGPGASEGEDEAPTPNSRPPAPKQGADRSSRSNKDAPDARGEGGGKGPAPKPVDEASVLRAQLAEQQRSFDLQMQKMAQSMHAQFMTQMQRLGELQAQPLQIGQPPVEKPPEAPVVQEQPEKEHQPQLSTNAPATTSTSTSTLPDTQHVPPQNYMTQQQVIPQQVFAPQLISLQHQQQQQQNLFTSQLSMQQMQTVPMQHMPQQVMQPQLFMQQGFAPQQQGLVLQHMMPQQQLAPQLMMQQQLVHQPPLPNPESTPPKEVALKKSLHRLRAEQIADFSSVRVSEIADVMYEIDRVQRKRAGL